MPTYEYECEKCGHRFEKFQNMSEKPVKSCPKCKAEVRRLIGGGAAVIFRGSGFYETDYKGSETRGTRCGREKPCCGRDAPCDSPPCSD